ncbi:MAG: S49 family peptidase, partial [Pseudobacteriovorax sp.]|nr:S49 family peptidase [Pseudobacteriovorax sp.]
ATTAKGIPVVVSMGSLAAAGGYWIAAGAEKILAYPNTLTGSIGVFAVARGFKTLANEHGITEDNVSTHALTKDLGFLNPRNAQIDAIRTLSVKNTYGKFLGLVSEGRDIPLDKVDAMAQGRILSGKKALELGLVDELGGYQDAIDAAAKLANLDSYEEQRIQREKTFEEILISKLSEVESQSKLLSQLSALEAVLSFIKPEVAKATDPLGINQTFVDCLCLPQ